MGLRHICTLCRVGRPQVLPFVCTYTAISVFLLLVYSISGVVFLGYFQVPACACALVPVCVCVSVCLCECVWACVRACVCACV